MQHDPRRGDRCDRRSSLSYLLSLSQRSLSEISAYLDDHEGGCPEKCFCSVAKRVSRQYVDICV